MVLNSEKYANTFNCGAMRKNNLIAEFKIVWVWYCEMGDRSLICWYTM